MAYSHAKQKLKKKGVAHFLHAHRPLKKKKQYVRDAKKKPPTSPFSCFRLSRNPSGVNAYIFALWYQIHKNGDKKNRKK